VKLVKAALAAALVSVLMSACSSDSGNSRTIEVDYRSDDFAGAFLGYYPRDLTVTPGMTLKFHQTWTGEPHTVTFGAVADEGLKNAPALMQLFRDYWEGGSLPDDAPAEYIAIFEEKLPSFFGERGINQGAAQPCYVEDESDLPLNGKSCTKAQQEQPEFTGEHALYSSGFIPFEGSRGNTFEMKIADDAKEGTYFYYCNAHGGPMSGEITIKQDAEVESQASMNRRGKEQSDVHAAPVLPVLAKEKSGQGLFPLPLAGSGDESVDAAAFANEFTPRTVETTVGAPVKWTFIGDHTISFNVPPYTPIFKTSKSGAVSFNPDLEKPRGGWPGAPEREEFDGPPGARPPDPKSVDAGEWNGSGGLHSTGLGFADGDTYTVTFTKAGSYAYACLIHPGMIGKVVVK
jgi:plastocyanin